LVPDRRVGEEIALTFKEDGVPFVIIENRPDCIARIVQTDYLLVEGDATKDEALEEAGIDAILIGETLMRSKDISQKIRELFGN